MDYELRNYLINTRNLTTNFLNYLDTIYPINNTNTSYYNYSNTPYTSNYTNTPYTSRSYRRNRTPYTSNVSNTPNVSNVGNTRYNTNTDNINRYTNEIRRMEEQINSINNINNILNRISRTTSSISNTRPTNTNISGTPTYNPIDTNPIDTNTSLRNRIRRVIPELIEITLYNNGRRVNTQNINDEVELQDVEISPSLTTIINNSSVSLYNNETYEQDSCRICMETLNTDDIIRKLNTCNHTFHLTSPTFLL